MISAIALRDARRALRTSLAEAAEKLRLPLSEQQSTQLLDFVELLVHWNRTYNLTAVRDPASMLTRHVVDCLAVVPALRRENCRGRVLDVGSGGGLPGVVWAVMEPDMDVTCVDSVGKKTAFLQQAVGSLGLGNLRGEHARAERLAAGRFDLIASRAFASLPDFAALTAHLISEGGTWLAMKGKVPTGEIGELASGVEVFHVEQVLVPGLAADRCLIWMRPTSSSTRSEGEANKKSVHSQSRTFKKADE